MALKNTSLLYTVEIERPESHLANVQVEGSWESEDDKMILQLPCWSPGSYLMREYAKHIHKVKVQARNGTDLFYQKKNKACWVVDWSHPENKGSKGDFVISYQAYCHELTVRTSHIDSFHAFLHGPSYLIGVKGLELRPKIRFKFPPIWSKLSTSLQDISQSREDFVYQASSYDVLLDTPVEIGCHQTDGFMVDKIPHELAWVGVIPGESVGLKDDASKLFKHIATFMGEIPFDRYLVIGHFFRDLYGGLEHLNSTAVQFDGLKMSDRMNYLDWLSLLGHEYFHAWNGKRLRPVGLGPFDYSQEAYTELLWVVEGLTSYLDQLFVYQSGLCSLEEYLKLFSKDLARFAENPGKRYQTIEESSFDSWIKFYRPNENSVNSTTSYYTKGALTFFALHSRAFELKADFFEMIRNFWRLFTSNPKVGYTRESIFAAVEKSLGKALSDELDRMVSTTEDIDFPARLAAIGLRPEYETNEYPELGFTVDSQGVVTRVVLDSSAYRTGLCAGDEIIALDQIRLLASEVSKLNQWVRAHQSYRLTVARNKVLTDVAIHFDPPAKKLVGIGIENREIAEKALSIQGSAIAK